MRRLILFRHAKAEPRGRGQDDIDRPLAPRGREDAALIAGVLAREKLTPDLALVSAAKRTQETWDCARAAFPAARMEVVDALYNASAEEIMAEAEAWADEGETLIIVGHNPGLHELAVMLLEEGGAPAWQVDKMDARFPTSTAAAFLIDPAGRASFDGLFLASEHGGEGE
ncbi:SixA phosphatase family protein [Caulobacter sp. KR2-114]|uniref:SixA phosphatase family protein n=1 Tax=Caulobacter sp. KR2-114 TaxID=3400912 RepID=UPI003BFB8F92